MMQLGYVNAIIDDNSSIFSITEEREMSDVVFGVVPDSYREKDNFEFLYIHIPCHVQMQ